MLRNLTRNLSLLGRYVFPPDVLRKISSRITNEVAGINRVTYDVSSKPPAVSPTFTTWIGTLLLWSSDVLTQLDRFQTVEWL